MEGYILSPEAQHSLKEIKNYSTNNFGVQRTKIYLQDMLNHFRELAANPSLGMKRDELKEGYHSSFIGSHTIYYRIKPQLIEIIDVLHQTMEPTKQLINKN